jgi:hypothetical protein
LERAEVGKIREGFAGRIEPNSGSAVAVIEAFLSSRPTREGHVLWEELKVPGTNPTMRQRWSAGTLEPSAHDLHHRFENFDLFGQPIIVDYKFVPVRIAGDRFFLHLIEERSLAPGETIYGGVVINTVTGVWWTWSLLPRM